MNLAIDQGNTQIKAALFDKEDLVVSYSNISLSNIQKLIFDKHPDRIIVSSVGKSLSINNAKNVLHLNSKTPVPFKNGYITPHTLGLDRIAAIAGAQELFPQKNCLTIDMGTCITYDFIDENAHYHGGGISPGMQMRFKAMNTFTANLPLEVPNVNVSLIGSSTSACIQSGVINGISAEINEIIRMYSDKYAHLQIIACGGDCGFFENRLKGPIFAAPELVLRGLNRILKYNVEDI